MISRFRQSGKVFTDSKVQYCLLI